MRVGFLNIAAWFCQERAGQDSQCSFVKFKTRGGRSYLIPRAVNPTSEVVTCAP